MEFCRCDIKVRSFASVDDYSKATQQDRHSLTLDYDIFIMFRDLTQKTSERSKQSTEPKISDFHLKPGSAAIDRGIVLPNITDGFTGQEPDLGGLELGQATPHYGSRQ